MRSPSGEVIQILQCHSILNSGKAGIVFPPPPSSTAWPFNLITHPPWWYFYLPVSLTENGSCKIWLPGVCNQSINQSIMSKALKSEEECRIHFLHDSNQLTQYSSCLRLWTLTVYSSCHSIVSQIMTLSITCCLLSHLLHYFSSRREILFCTHIDWEGLLFVFLWISHMWFILLFLYLKGVELFLKLLTME